MPPGESPDGVSPYELPRKQPAKTGCPPPRLASSARRSEPSIEAVRLVLLLAALTTASGREALAPAVAPAELHAVLVQPVCLLACTPGCRFKAFPGSAFSC